VFKYFSDIFKLFKCTQHHNLINPTQSKKICCSYFWQNIMMFGNEEERRNMCRMNREKWSSVVLTTPSVTLFSISGRWIKYCYMEWFWKWPVEFLRKKNSVSVTYCPQQIPNGQIWDRTRSPTVTTRRITVSEIL
jgi:hypothetical protein